MRMRFQGVLYVMALFHAGLAISQEDFESCLNPRNNLVEALCEEGEKSGEGFFSVAGRWQGDTTDFFEEIVIDPLILMKGEARNRFKWVRITFKRPQKQLLEALQNGKKSTNSAGEYQILTHSSRFSDAMNKASEDLSTISTLTKNETAQTTAIIPDKYASSLVTPKVVGRRTFSKTFSTDNIELGSIDLYAQKTDEKVFLEVKYTPVTIKWPPIQLSYTFSRNTGEITDGHFYDANRPSRTDEDITPSITKGTPFNESFKLTRIP